MTSSLTGIVRSNNNHQLTRPDWCGYRSIIDHAVTSSLTIAAATLTTSCTAPTLLRVATVCLMERTGCGYRPLNQRSHYHITDCRCNVDCDSIVYYINMTGGNCSLDRTWCGYGSISDHTITSLTVAATLIVTTSCITSIWLGVTRSLLERTGREREREREREGLRLVFCYYIFNVKRRGFPISVSSH